MPIKLNSSGGGSVTLDVGSTASTFTQTFPSVSGNVVTTGSTGVVTTAMLAAGASSLVTGTAVASTSGTSIDFTGIPSWARRITIIFNEVSTSGTGASVVQLGTSAGVINTGYLSTSVGIAPAPGVTSYTNGFGIRNDAASYVLSGHMVLTLVSGNTWISSHYGKVSTAVGVCGGGSIALSGVLTTVRYATGNGTDTFDAGSVNIMYE